MAYALKYNGSIYMVAPTLGNTLTFETLDIISDYVLIDATAGFQYIYSQAAQFTTTRELALYINSSSNLGVYIGGGAQQSLGDVVTIFGSTIIEGKLQFTVDYINGLVRLYLDDVECPGSPFSITVGGSRNTGVGFRIGSRADNTTSSSSTIVFPNGTIVGDTQIFIDGAMARNYVSDGTGDTWEDIASAQHAALFNSPGNDSQWELYGEQPDQTFTVTPAGQNSLINPLTITQQQALQLIAASQHTVPLPLPLDQQQHLTVVSAVQYALASNLSLSQQQALLVPAASQLALTASLNLAQQQTFVVTSQSQWTIPAALTVTTSNEQTLVVLPAEQGSSTNPLNLSQQQAFQVANVKQWQISAARLLAQQQNLVVTPAHQLAIAAVLTAVQQQNLHVSPAVQNTVANQIAVIPEGELPDFTDVIWVRTTPRINFKRTTSQIAYRRT